MFPTFISILDIQSWWEVPSIAHFCSLFRTAFNLLDFDIEDLEEALLTDGTEETSWLQELIVRLLIGCLPNNEISTFNYQMFLRRLFREKCKEHDRYNPFNTDIDFQLLPLRTKVDILHALCDFRLDAEDVLEQLKNLEADSLRVEPLGYDNNESAYWYFYGTRLYREDFNTKNNKKGKSVWQVVCFTEEDWFQLSKKFKKSQSKAERQLYRTLTENFLPELPRLFCEKERLARKRLLENQPRRTSSRLDTKRKQELVEQAEKAKLDTVSEKGREVVNELKSKKDLERRRQEAYERRARLRELDPDSEGGNAKSRNEMAGNKKRDKHYSIKQKQDNSDCINSTDLPSNVTRASNREAIKTINQHSDKTQNVANTRSNNASASTTVGRQTNNSLASATGQILIQPVSNPHRKKLKTSQVFCQTDEDLQTGMHKILDYVKNHDDAWPFVDPVEEEFAPNYYTVIRKPMDLQRMEDRLDSRYYKSFSRFRADFQLIVDNCRLYNGVDNEYTQMVGNLSLVFEKATERYLDQITSSDDEIAVEYPKAKLEDKALNSKVKKDNTNSSSLIPSAVTRTDKKGELFSEDSSGKRNNLFDSVKSNINEKKQSKNRTLNDSKTTKKIEKPIIEHKKQESLKKINLKRGRKPKKSKPKPRNHRTRSRSRSYSSLSPDNRSSSPPSSSSSVNYDSDHSIERGKKKKFNNDQSNYDVKGRSTQRNKWADSTKNDGNKHGDKKTLKVRDNTVLPPKQKDKHNKLRETIEKLKAKSEISNKLKDVDDEDLISDTRKENCNSSCDQLDNKYKKQNLHKSMFKNKLKSNKNDKLNLASDDENSIADSVQSDKKKNAKKGNLKNNATKNAAIEALTLATEQTLKDINKWLDDTPRLSEFSSASNSPSNYIGAEEIDGIGNKLEHDYRKKDKHFIKKDNVGKDIKRRSVTRDPTKFLKKREIQRTIDRLQPGKSKGNLLSNIQNVNKVDDLFPLGPLSKVKDSKNSLIVKTSETTPKLSLGSVLDSFGKHKFVDDVKAEDECDKKKSEIVKESSDPSIAISKDVENSKMNPQKTGQVKVKEDSLDASVSINVSSGKATPNLSAWFKAFGAPKVLPNQKKPDSKSETKEIEKLEEIVAKPQDIPEQIAREEYRKNAPADIPSNPNSPSISQGQPIQRQRKISTGSTVSERSSFSQDMDSPRVGIDERLGVYPAPYPSPLHRSPSGASPVMASPRPDISPKATYPTVNGQIRVGFYQDTVSTKSSPDKSCSPRDNPQSPYVQYSEHVYTPTTTENATYSYNSSYYSQMSNYSPSTVPSYNAEPNNPNYYDTNKSLTDQYQAKATTSYHSVTSPTFQNVNSPNYSASSPNYQSTIPNSPNYHTSNSVPCNVTQLPSPVAQQTASYETFRQQQVGRVTDQVPVKKRAYNETDPSQIPSINQPDQQNLFDRNYDPSILPGRHASVGMTNSPQQLDVRPNSCSPQQYVHQNIPNPRLTNSHGQNNASSQVAEISNSVKEPVTAVLQQQQQQTNHGNISNVNSFPPSTNMYNFNNETGYPINHPGERPLDLNARPDSDKKIDMSKYTNMGYTGPEIGFTRNPQQYNRVDLNYARSTILTDKSNELQPSTVTNSQSMQESEILMRYGDSNYRNVDSNPTNVSSQKVTHLTNLNLPQNTVNRMNPVSETYKTEMSVPKPSYSSTTALNVDHSLGLRGNLTNLSHIVDRFSTDNMYYADKSLTPSHMYSKSIVTNSSSLPMFSQSYSHEMQATQSAMYNRQLTELQPPLSTQNQPKPFPQQQEKKPKRRKNKPAASVDTIVSSASNQGFQSYTGLKNSSTMDPSTISLKTASVVPGSAFNFGPTPPGLGLSSGLYGDKDAYPNFLEDYRAAPNYYMAAAAAAAHRRSTPDTNEKQTMPVHQPPTSATAAYPFIGAPQPRPSTYPLGGAFMPPHQAPPLMEPSSPLYQQYLQAGVLHQSLLGPPGAYPPGYHPALSIRQPFDSMTRPSWL